MNSLSQEIFDQEIFDHEIAICQQLAKKNNGECNWGKCKDCGVLPLLYKLHKGVLLEKPDEIKKLKNGQLGDFLK